MRKTLILIFILSFCTTALHAQWSGNASVEGGWNFMEENKENAAFNIKYTGRKFYIGTNLSAGHSYLPSTQSTMIIDGKKAGDEYYKSEDKAMKPRNANAAAGIIFGYIFNPANTLDVTWVYTYKGKDDYPILSTERYGVAVDDKLNGTQMDTLLNMRHTLDGKITYIHKFEGRPDARLAVLFDNNSSLTLDENCRVTSGNYYSKPKHYATYSDLFSIGSKLTASYDDRFNFNESSLKLSSGTDFIVNQDLDLYSAETMVNGHWRDSTEYRQTYSYYSLSIEPFVDLTYTVGKFDFSIKERLQWYRHSLADRLEEEKSPDEDDELFDKHDWENLISTGATYRVNDRNRFSVEYSRSISRPEYKKLCTTLTIGSSEGEYIIGNPNLKPELTNKLSLKYTYSKGIFLTTLDINYRKKTNTAEKVIDVESKKEVTDPGVKTIYTWINNKRQDSYGTKFDLKMNGSDVKAEIWAGLNYDRYGTHEQFNKEDYNYELGTSINVFLNETTEMSSSLVYVSARQSAYNLKGEDVVASLKLTKTLRKGLKLFAELYDIADKDLYEETWNEEYTYLKITTTRPFDRIATLGLSYSF